MQFRTREDMLRFDQALEPLRKAFREQMANHDKLKQLGHLEEDLRKLITENSDALKREPALGGPLQKISEAATRLYKEKSEGHPNDEQTLFPK